MVSEINVANIFSAAISNSYDARKQSKWLLWCWIDRAKFYLVSEKAEQEQLWSIWSFLFYASFGYLVNW